MLCRQNHYWPDTISFAWYFATDRVQHILTHWTLLKAQGCTSFLLTITFISALDTCLNEIIFFFCSFSGKFLELTLSHVPASLLLMFTLLAWPFFKEVILGYLLIGFVFFCHLFDQRLCLIKFFFLVTCRTFSFILWGLDQRLISSSSLVHMKITASVTKSLHQVCGLHILLFCWKIKSCCDYISLSKLDHKPLFNNIYYEIILVWGLVSLWLSKTLHIAYSIHHVS